MPLKLSDACAAPSMASSCANGSVRRASRRLGQIYDEAFVGTGLKATQYSLLSHIARGREPKMRDLADALVMDLSALSHSLKPLVRDGLVNVQVDELDRRSRRVLLTENGWAKYREAQVISERVSAIFENAFGIEETVKLRSALDMISSDTFAQSLLEQLHVPKP